ncbi:MAG: 50S ribosomal protein L11 methyltransferase [Fusobacterium sp.]|uniref:50S ribosomal protein L11 methyltransferase n=1 Tax=Fusobacterium sp. TaxID=68766 RepID=UPI0026DAA57A|nr:50S ribosomal protein L11 methyltransferase [Fusobacterium sp.]MDO4690771.1 50S ribosomal protein L11 methyltransferase [Fusobacterium sp.]
MKVLEAKLLYESDNIEKYKKLISDIFYSFGVTGLKIEEPILNKDPLNFYKDEKKFLQSENSISAYFPMNIYSEKRKEALKKTFANKFKDDENIVYSLCFYEYDEDDYQNSWKKYLFVEKVSEKFIVKPTWRSYEKKNDEFVIELDPGRAFGTGSHPTTSLLLKLMEKENFFDKRVIDIGTGSGILMIAASLLGAKEIYGTDIDELSIEVASENLLLNKIDMSQIKILKGNLLEILNNEKFDIVLCNILSDVLIKLLDEIKFILKSESKVMLSGIIEDKLASIISKAKEVGLEVEEIKEDKEWRAIILKKAL